MRNLRFKAGLGVIGLLAAVTGIILMHPHNASADPDGMVSGASFVTTVKDSNGAFASRGVITLHADHTVSVVDSGQGGPTFFFTSQLGSWGYDRDGTLVAKTLDFDYPPNADAARLDYRLHVQFGGKHLSGTITLTSFPLENGNPLGGGGTPLGSFTLTGDLITP